MVSFRQGTITNVILVFLLVTQADASHKKLHHRGNRAANKTLIVTSILTAPFLFEKEFSQRFTGNDRYEGYIPDLLATVCRQLGVEYRLKLVEDGKYGQQLPDGSWDGMMGDLTRGDADMVAAPLTVNSQRVRAVDFTYPFMTFGYAILMKKPALSSNSGGPTYVMLLEPFPIEVWTCLGLCYVVVSLILFLLSRFLKRGRETRSEDTLRRVRAKELGPQMADSFWWTARSLLFQGWSSQRWPTSLAVRVLSCAWFIFSLLTVLLYLVSLNHFLPHRFASSQQLAVSSPDDLAKQTEIKYGVVEGGATQTFFKTSQVAVYERMWNFMESTTPSIYVSSTEGGVERVRDSSDTPYAFITESSTSSYLVNRKPCDLVQVGDLMNELAYGFATPIGSDLYDRLNLAILELKEGGELKKLQRKWWYDKGQCRRFTSGESEHGGAPVFRALGLTDFAGPLIVLAAGILLAILVAVLEAVVDKACAKSGPLSAEGNEEQQLKTTDPATF